MKNLLMILSLSIFYSCSSSYEDVIFLAPVNEAGHYEQVVFQEIFWSENDNTTIVYQCRCDPGLWEFNPKKELVSSTSIVEFKPVVIQLPKKKYNGAVMYGVAYKEKKNSPWACTTHGGFKIDLAGLKKCPDTIRLLDIEKRRIK